MINHLDSNKAWIDATAAVKAASKGILDYGLNRNPDVALAIQSGYPGAPLCVERLDKPGIAYYLIPWLTNEGVVFVVRVDASNGALLGVTTYPKPTPSPFLSPDEALDYAAQKFPRHSFSESRLGWKPCRESTSPTRPFYRIPFVDGVLYINMDGKVFQELTPLGFGN